MDMVRKHDDDEGDGKVGGARCEVGNLRGTVRGIRARNGVISEAASMRGRAIVLYEAT